MMEEIRGAPILRGSRGKAPIHTETIIETLLSISKLLAENPDILEIEINPMIMNQKGGFAVDARGIKLLNP
jgi:hypothetical protein